MKNYLWPFYSGVNAVSASSSWIRLFRFSAGSVAARSSSVFTNRRFVGLANSWIRGGIGRILRTTSTFAHADGHVTLWSQARRKRVLPSRTIAKLSNSEEYRFYVGVCILWLCEEIEILRWPHTVTRYSLLLFKFTRRSVNVHFHGFRFSRCFLPIYLAGVTLLYRCFLERAIFCIRKLLDADIERASTQWFHDNHVICIQGYYLGMN